MAKLIRTPNECGYRIANQACAHSKWDGKLHPCIPKGEKNFPSCCPLEEGKLLKLYKYEPR
jgi:hypothetical protein